MKATDEQLDIMADIRELDALVARLHVHPRQHAVRYKPSQVGRALRTVHILWEVRDRYLEKLAHTGMPDGYEFDSLWTGSIGGFSGYGDHTRQTLYGPPTELDRKPEVGFPKGKHEARIMAWNHALPDLRELERREMVKDYYAALNAESED